MSNIINRFREKDQVLFAEVEKLKSGDAESFNTVYELSKNYIYKIIWDIVKSQDAADDIMQETYLQIYNKVSGLADVSAFYSWAGRIATNFCLTYIKREKKYVLAEADESGEAEDFIFERASDDHEAMIPESIIMNKEQQKIIADILDSLSTEQKLCVQYYYFEELSVKEIAEIMETSEGTIKSRLNYARKSIKSAVENIERRDGTKLYSIGSFPLLFLIFREGADILFGAVTASAAGVAGAAAGATINGGTVAGTTAMDAGTVAGTAGTTMNGGAVAGTAGTSTGGATGAGYIQGPVRGNVPGASPQNMADSVGNTIQNGAGKFSNTTGSGSYGSMSAKTAAKVAAKKLSLAAKIFIAATATTVVAGGIILAVNNKKDDVHEKYVEEQTEEAMIEGPDGLIPYSEYVELYGEDGLTEADTPEDYEFIDEETETFYNELTDDTTEEQTETTTFDSTEADTEMTEVASVDTASLKQADYSKVVEIDSAFSNLISIEEGGDILYFSSTKDDPNNYVILRVDPLAGGGASISVASSPLEFKTEEDSTSGIYTIDDCLGFMSSQLSGMNLMLEYTENGADCYYIYVSLYTDVKYGLAIGYKNTVPDFITNSDGSLTVSGAYQIYPYLCDEYKVD